MSEPAVARIRKKPAAKTATTTKPAARRASKLTVAAGAADLFRADDQVQRVIAVLGSNAVARVLGVSNSQPSRWRSGMEQVSAENRRKLSDLDYVLDRLLLELYPDDVGMWLTSPNAHLGGARPADVLQLRGPAAVLPAIDALTVGAFA